MGLRDFISQRVFIFARARSRARSRVLKIAASLLIFSAPFPTTLISAQQTFQTATQNVSNSDLGISLSAVDFLGRSQDERAVAILSAALGAEKRMPVRRGICDALGLLHFPSGRKTLITALRDPEPQVRQSAVVALSTIGGKESDSALVQHAQNEKDFGVKAHLIPALGRARDPKALDRLKKLKDDDDENIGRMADQEFIKHSGNKTN